MAIYHLEAKVITRGIGRTACGAAAYMSCSKLYNDYDGIQRDYTHKHGLVWERVFLPTMAPAEWNDRESLWNAVEAAEKTKDSQLAREFIVALPRELDTEAWKTILTEYIQDNFVADGMCADVSVHDTDGENPHAHILLTMRPLNENGTWQHKAEKEYLCVRDGEEHGFTASEFKLAQAEGWEKQYQYYVGKKKKYMTPSEAESKGLSRASKYAKSTKYGRKNAITARWNSEEQLIAWRAAWADAVNRALERSGVEARIDHRSHAERGIDERPTIHEGASARKMEKAGFVSDRCELNRQIRADNALIRELKALIAKLVKAVKMTLAELARAMEQVRQDIIVFTYGVLHNREYRAKDLTYLGTIAPKYKEYADAGKAITEKARQRKALKAELAALSPFELRERRDLRRQIDALTKNIADLRASRTAIMEELGQEDTDGMNEVKADVEATRVRLDKYYASDTDLMANINKSKARFKELKKQAAEFERGELTDARLAIRPEMESAAHERIARNIKGGKVSFWNYTHSITDTDELLDEADMTERRRAERQREEREHRKELQQRKRRSQEQER